MEQIIHNYESIYIISSALSEEEIKAVIEKFSALISANGTLESVEEWGSRKLAYPIDDLSEGYYVLVNFKSDANFPAELDRIFKITDGVIRSIIIRKDK